jgi:hypothetical protein
VAEQDVPEFVEERLVRERRDGVDRNLSPWKRVALRVPIEDRERHSIAPKDRLMG